MARRRTTRPLLALTLLLASAVVTPPAAADSECTVGKTRYVDTPSYALVRLAAGRSWQLSVGDGVTVAVVESGVGYANAHLEDVVLPGRFFVDGEPDPCEDDWGHGTAIAGIVAGKYLEQSSVIGLAPGAQILPVRVFRADATTSSTPTPAERPSTDRMAAGIRWAAEQGAGVINVSMSSTSDDPALRAAVRFAVRESVRQIAYRIMASADRPQRFARDDVRGWGLIQPYESLTMTLDPSRPGPALPGADQRAAPAPEPVVAPVSASPDPLDPVRESALWWSLFLGGLVVLRPWIGRSREGS